MDDKLKFIFAASFAAGIVVAGSITMFSIEQSERAKRREIEKNLQLDLTAIRNAKTRMIVSIKNGRYDNQYPVDIRTIIDEMNQQIAFEKIAVRYTK